jgi:hypothetical protein
MRFLRRNQYLLAFVAVLVFAAVMVVRQFIANQSAHVQMREDFLVLHDRREIKSCERIYQVLIQQLPDLDDRALADDLERTAMIVDPKTPDLDNLVWKYHTSVKNELQKRAEQRLSRAVERADQ